MSAELFDLGMDFSGLNDGVDIGSVLSIANLASASSALNQTASSSEAECRLMFWMTEPMLCSQVSAKLFWINGCVVDE